MTLLHLITLLPGDNLSEKIKAYLIDNMRLTPNLKSLDEVMAYILSLQEHPGKGYEGQQASGKGAGERQGSSKQEIQMQDL